MNALFTLAWRNLWRNWRRTVIGVLAIVIGLVLLLLLDGLIAGSDRAIFGNAVRLYGGHIVVHAPGYRARASRLPILPLADAERAVAAAEALPGVAAVARRINTSGFVTGGGKSHPVVIAGIEPQREAPVSIVAEGIAQGRFLAADEGAAIVIGRGLAEALGAGVGDRIALVGRGRGDALHQSQMTVVGIYDLGMRDAERGLVFMTLGEAQRVYRLRDQATEVAVTLSDANRQARRIAELRAALPGDEVDGWTTLRPEIKDLLETKGGFTTFIGFVVLLIACIGVLNILLMSVFERTREMGVLAALGMKNRQLMGLFLLEGTLLGAVGGAVGCVLGVIVLWLVGLVGIDISMAQGLGEIGSLMGSRIYPYVSPTGVVGRGVAVALIAALASLHPAWLATRRQPAEVLHHV